jgi:hypothetical protein
MLIPISYPLNRGTPFYPGTEPLAITPTRSLNGGDAEEMNLISFSSHAGTHIDLPRRARVRSHRGSCETVFIHRSGAPPFRKSLVHLEVPGA